MAVQLKSGGQLVNSEERFLKSVKILLVCKNRTTSKSGFPVIGGFCADVVKGIQ
jgi:hypothetical protein